MVLSYECTEALQYREININVSSIISIIPGLKHLDFFVVTNFMMT